MQVDLQPLDHASVRIVADRTNGGTETWPL